MAGMPLGGVKDLGYGFGGEPEALDVYLNTRSVLMHSD
jgi:acyl-CoA reductase-like NAD-dependent aldehyde dehydrogenase